MGRYDPIAASESAVRKIRRIFKGLAKNRVERVRGDHCTDQSMRIIHRVFRRTLGDKAARDFAVHMADWNGDAAFMVAFHLFPERFTADEIRAGITNAVIHAPNHMAAAAKLAGYPVTDVFEVGALDGDPELDRIRVAPRRRNRTKKPLR